jgi:DNA polymerase-1
MTVLLLDAYNLLFRSFTSLPPGITAGDGLPINAVYGMLAFVLRLKQDIAPDHIVAAFDVPEVPTFRHRLFPAYQAQRGPLGGENAEDFSRQVGIAFELFPRLGVPAVAVPGFEADDVMGTIGTAAGASGDRAVIVSTDRDLLQLVSKGIEILVPGKGNQEIRTEHEVIARIGVAPHAVTTFKALAGDASDNIPGLPGIGTKTAISLVERLGVLDSIYQRLDEVPARPQAVLREHRAEAYLYREIVTVRTDIALPLDPRHLPRPSFDAGDRVRTLLDRHGYGPPETQEDPGA